MTDTQLYLAIGVPVVSNAIMFLLFATIINARFTDLRQELSSIQASINQRFDDMRELWRTELRRVEEVLDARLKHIEEERR